MKPATRTPEGEPGKCPLCGHTVCLEPSRPPGDAPCPHCGNLIWFGPASVGLRVDPPRSRLASFGTGRQRVYFLAKELGLKAKVVELLCREIGIQIGSSLASLSGEQAEAVVEHAKRTGLLR
jgi:hypothetical protein